MKFVFLLFTISFLVTIVLAQKDDINLDELRCAVCEVTLDELEKHLSSISPTREMEIGNYRLDAQGNDVRKRIPMSRSEVYISDKLDSICGNLDNYARVKDKKTGKLMVVNLFDISGGMNSLLSEVDIISDMDMNKSLKYYCERVVEEHEEEIIKAIQTKETNLKTKVCADIVQLCKNEPEEDSKNYVDIDKTEL